MANELLVGVKIGAVLSGTFQSAFASARGTSLKLGQAADELRVRHARLGEVMARAMSHPTRNLGELRRLLTTGSDSAAVSSGPEMSCAGVILRPLAISSMESDRRQFSPFR